MKHDAFISYSHAADGRLAPSLQQGLEQLAKPWYRKRALRVFRDETNLSASPQLWQSIVDELAEARWFLLLASAESAQSKWVTREVQWWLDHRDPRQLLILLTGGELLWDESSLPPDFDWSRTTALPAALRRVFAAEPHFVDVRDLKNAATLTLKHTAFRAAVLKIAAPLHGRSPDEMEGEAVRTYKRNRRWAVAGAASLVALTAAALWQRSAAVQARDIALSRQLAAQSTAMVERSVDTALLLAVQAWRTKPTPEARSAMLRGLQIGPVARFLPGPGSAVVAVAIDPQARWVVAAGETGGIVRVPSDGSAPDWSYHSDQTITSMAMSPDGKVLAIGCHDGRVLLLSPGRPTPLHVLQGRHKERITALAFSADGLRLVSGSKYQGIALWDVAEGNALGGVPEKFNRGSIDALVVDADGRRVFAAMDLGIAVWDSTGWTPLGELGDGKPEMLVHSMSAGPGPTELTVAGWENNDRKVWRWPTAPADATPSVLQTKVGGLSTLAYSADRRVLALGTLSGDVGFRVAGTESDFRVHKGSVRSVAISDDSRWVVSGGEDGRVVLWERDSSPHHSGNFGQDTRGVAGLAASADGSFLVSGNAKGELLWISAGALAPTLRVGPELSALGEASGKHRGVMAAAVSPDGQRLAVGLGDGTTVVQLLARDGAPHRVRDWGPGYPVLALAFSPDGETLVTAHYDGSVVLRDGRTGAPRGEPANIINDSSDAIRTLTFSSDGKRLLVKTGGPGVVVRDIAALARASRATIERALEFTARRDGAVIFTVVARSPASSLWAWGSNQGQVELRQSDNAPADGPPLVVEGGLDVRGLTFSPDGQTLAVSGVGPGIMLWDLRERRPVDVPLGIGHSSQSMAFTNDGRFLVTRYSDAPLEWWSTDGDNWAVLLCAIANRPFTDREWATYVGGRRSADAACERAPR